MQATFESALRGLSVTGASVDTRELVELIVRHGEEEGALLATYEQLRRRYPAVLGDRLPLVLYGRRGPASIFVVRVSETSRKAADTLCAKLRPAGGACIVLRNPSS